MKNKLLKIVAILALITGMAGIVEAAPCPGINGVDTASKMTPLVNAYSTGGNSVRDYYLTTNFEGDIKEYCIYPNNAGSTLVPDPIVVFDPAITHWSATLQPGNNPTQLRMKSDTDAYNINSPASGLTDKHIAQVTYSGSDPAAPEQYIVLHIRNNAICYTGVDPNLDEDNDPATCFVRNGPGEQIPEFPTMALPVAAVMGIMFLMMRSRKKANL